MSKLIGRLKLIYHKTEIIAQSNVENILMKVKKNPNEGEEMLISYCLPFCNFFQNLASL